MYTSNFLNLLPECFLSPVEGMPRNHCAIAVNPYPPEASASAATLGILRIPNASLNVLHVVGRSAVTDPMICLAINERSVQDTVTQTIRNPLAFQKRIWEYMVIVDMVLDQALTSDEIDAVEIS